MELRDNMALPMETEAEKNARLLRLAFAMGVPPDLIGVAWPDVRRNPGNATGLDISDFKDRDGFIVGENYAEVLKSLDIGPTERSVSITRHVMQHFATNFANERDDAFMPKVKEKLIERLADLGYTFDTDKAFMKFINSRLTRGVETIKGHRHNHLLLDYIDDNNNGTRVLSYYFDYTITDRACNMIAAESTLFAW